MQALTGREWAFLWLALQELADGIDAGEVLGEELSALSRKVAQNTTREGSTAALLELAAHLRDF